MFPLFTTRCLHVRHDVRDLSGGSGNCGRECCPLILPKWRLPRHLGIFYMPQIYRRLYFPSEGRRTEDFFWPLKIRRLRPGLNPRTWVLKASTLPLDHRIQKYSDSKQRLFPHTAFTHWSFVWGHAVSSATYELIGYVYIYIYIYIYNVD